MDYKSLLKYICWKCKEYNPNIAYPPIISWKKQISKKDIFSAWEETSRIIRKNPSQKIWVYVHIPFCETQCLFCDCVTKVEKNHSKYEKYIQDLIVEMWFFSDMFKGIKFDNLYFGGWTPTIVWPKLLDVLLKKLKESFDFSAARQIMIEWSPYTTTDEIIWVLSSHWVNKITFWVQSLDEDTLRQNNRPQTLEQVQRAVEICKKHGIDSVNLDLMAGIPGQTQETFLKTMKVCEELESTSIQVNYFMPTKNTNYTKAKRVLLQEEINMRNTMIRESRSTWYEENNLDISARTTQIHSYIEDSCSIVWLWYGAFSHAFNTLFYMHDSPDSYQKYLYSSSHSSTLWYKIDHTHEEILFVIHNLRGGIFNNKFKNIFWYWIEDSILFPKIQDLINKWILKKSQNKDGEECISSHSSWEFKSTFYWKYFYQSEIIKEFTEFYKKEESFYKDGDMWIKAFFYD